MLIKQSFKTKILAIMINTKRSRVMACMVGDNVENKEEGNSIKGWKFMVEDYDLRVKKSLMIIVPMNIV